MSKKRLGLLVMAYGTPYEEEDIERYYTHIRHGRKPSEESLADLKSRYEAIGGISPLARITASQAQKLEDYLNASQDEFEFKMYLGLKHIEPFIEDAVEQMYADGVEEAVSIVLAPHYSTFSIKSYNGRAQETAQKLGDLKIHSIDSWYDEPKFIEYWAKGMKSVESKMTEEERANYCLIVSAHSLPEKIISMGDPYPEQLEETAKLIQQAANIKNVEVGWQSAGQTPEPWLGPDVQDLTRDLYKEKEYKAFVYIPVGFICDHLEVLYDNDYECKVVCDELGVGYYRPEMPNDKDEFIEILGTVVHKLLNNIVIE